MKWRLMLAIFALSFCAVTACGNKAEKTTEETVKVEKVEESVVVETLTPEPVAEEPTPEATPEPTPESETSTWFEEHELSITPQGDFTYQTMAHDANNQDTREIDIASNISIKETTEGAEEGYKKVIATFHEDVSVVNRQKEGFLAWHSAFDRYTGIAFEVASDAIIDKGLHKGSIPIEYDGNLYDVSISYDFNSNDTSSDLIITVTCPVDYDGTIFQAGYTNQEMDKKNGEMDLSALHTLDEFPQTPSNGHTYYYFSYSNE